MKDRVQQRASDRKRANKRWMQERKLKDVLTKMH